MTAYGSYAWSMVGSQRQERGAGVDGVRAPTGRSPPKRIARDVLGRPQIINPGPFPGRRARRRTREWEARRKVPDARPNGRASGRNPHSCGRARPRSPDRKGRPSRSCVFIRNRPRSFAGGLELALQRIVDHHTRRVDIREEVAHAGADRLRARDVHRPWPPVTPRPDRACRSHGKRRDSRTPRGPGDLRVIGRQRDAGTQAQSRPRLRRRRAAKLSCTSPIELPLENGAVPRRRVSDRSTSGGRRCRLPPYSCDF